MRKPSLLLVSGLLFALALGGCGSRNETPPTPSIATLEEDPILLSRVLERCNANPAAVSAPECTNARAAADRRMAEGEAAKAKRAEAGFEMAREARRRADEAARQSHDATQKRMDAYELPVEGAEPPAQPAP